MFLELGILSHWYKGSMSAKSFFVLISWGPVISELPFEVTLDPGILLVIVLFGEYKP